MLTLQGFSIFASLASVVMVVVGLVRGFQTEDAKVLEQSARRLGWISAGAFLFSLFVFAVATVGVFGVVGSGVMQPQDRASILATGLNAPGVFLRWSGASFFAALLGVATLRGRASYLTPNPTSPKS